jgi:predicted PurR-regulated permease PerM
MVGLNALGVLALGFILYQLRPLLALLATALMIGLALDPLVRLFERAGLKRGWGVLLSVLCVLALFALVVVSVVPVVVDQVRSLLNALPGFVAQVGESEWLRELDSRFSVLEGVERELPSLPRTVAGEVVGVLSTTAGALVATLTVLTVSIFGLLSGRQLFDEVLGWVEPERRREVRSLASEMRRAVSGYLVGVILICALGALVTGVSSFLLGVPYFLALGLLYLVLGFIPYIGSLLVALAVSLTTFATVGLRRALIALALFMVYQQIEGNVLQPLIQRRTMQMNPLLISIVVIAGAMLMGVLGAVLALPLAAALQVLLLRVRDTRQARWEQQAALASSATSTRPPAAEPRREAPPASEDAEEPLRH